MTSPRREIPLTFLEVQVADGIATLTLNRPQAGNALNWALLEQLRAALRQAIESADVRAIVITAAGKRFVSGADVGFFVRCLESGDLGRIVECIRASQEVFAEIAACRKPVVAAVQGAAVGGGVELALACQHIVTTPRASFSFPETSLGIVPSSGGTYRAPRQIGVELTKWLVYTGHVLAPPKALAIGLVDQLVMPEELMEAAEGAARGLCDGEARGPKQAIAPAAELEVWRLLFGGASVAVLRERGPAEDRTVSTALRAMAERPLLALAWSEKLLDAALATTEEQGAAAALAAVRELFGSEEVHARLARAAQQQMR